MKPISLLRVLGVFAFALQGIASLGNANAQQPGVDVRVHPRVGLFNEIQYRDARDKRVPDILKGQEGHWKPLDARRYMEQAFDALGQVVRGRLGTDWEIVTTFDPASSYSIRRARLTVQPEAGGVPITGCSTAGVAGIVKAAVGVPQGIGCSIDIEILANTAVVVPVSYRSPKTGNAFVAITDPVIVPEDYLIVVAGDSYASGEGNPDRPCRQSVSLATTVFQGLFGCTSGPALWMDEQCHRSMWSAGLRTAMRIVGTDEFKRRGGYTVLSLACSGARVDQGMVSSYTGIKTIEIVRKNHDDLGLGNSLVEVAREIPPQLDVLREILGRERGRGGKAAADVMILSGGGNDLGFGDVVLDSILHVSPKDRRDKVRLNLEGRLATYVGGQKAFAEKLWAVPASLLVYVPYPDVTGMSQYDDLALRCDGNALELLNDYKGGAFSIDNEERALAYQVLVQELNDKNRQFADLYRIRMLERGPIDTIFKRRGWCARDAGPGPYSPGLRLLRKADESLAYQSGPNGTMHPTFEGHEIFAEEIFAAITAAPGAPVKVAVADPFDDPAAKRTYARSPLRISTTGAQPAGARLEVCKGDPELTFSNCAKGAIELEFANGSVARPTVTLIDDGTRRRFREALGEFVIDAEKPILSPCVMQRPGKPPADCGKSWLTKDDVLSFRADDGKGTGVASFEVRAGDTVLPGAAAAPGVLALPAASLPGGRLTLVAQATDRVGNVGTLPVAVYVDTTPPRLVRISAYGASVEIGGSRRVPAVDGQLELRLEAEDRESGVASGFFRVGPAGKETAFNTESYATRVGECATFSDTLTTYAETMQVDVGLAATKVEVFARDCVRLSSVSASVAVQPIRARPDGAMKAPAEWGAAPAAAGALFKDGVRGMTSTFSAPPDPADTAEYAVFSAWLNLADGRVAPGRPVGIALGGDCTVTAAAVSQPTLYALLRGAEDCAVRFGFEPEKRAALMGQVAAGLPN